MSNNLIFRPWVHTDSDELVRIANDYLVSQHLAPRFPYPYTKVDAETFIAKKEKFCVAMHYAPFIPIGGCGVEEFEDEMSIGYWLGRDYWGSGNGF